MLKKAAYTRPIPIYRCCQFTDVLRSHSRWLLYTIFGALMSFKSPLETTKTVQVTGTVLLDSWIVLTLYTHLEIHIGAVQKGDDCLNNLFQRVISGSDYLILL